MKRFNIGIMIIISAKCYPNKISSSTNIEQTLANSAASELMVMYTERNDFVIGTNQGKANVIFVKKTDRFITIVN